MANMLYSTKRVKYFAIIKTDIVINNVK